MKSLDFYPRLIEATAMPIPAIIGALLIMLSLLLGVIGIGGADTVVTSITQIMGGDGHTRNQFGRGEPASALVALPDDVEPIQPGEAMRLILRDDLVGLDVPTLSVAATDPKSDGFRPQLPGPDWYTLYTIDGCERRYYGVHTGRNNDTLEGFKPLMRNPSSCGVTQPDGTIPRKHLEFYEVVGSGMAMYYDKRDHVYYLERNGSAIAFTKLEE